VITIAGIGDQDPGIADHDRRNPRSESRNQRSRCSGIRTITRGKLAKSPAEYWIFVLQGFASRTTDFVVVPRNELLRRLDTIHGRQKLFQVYLWTTERNMCWETRGLSRAQELQVAHGSFADKKRDFTSWLNNWAPITQLNNR
jgi:hypothetical protein